MEPVRLDRGFQRVRMLGDSRNAESIGDTADRDDQRIVEQPAPRNDLGAALVERGRDRDLVPHPIQTFKRAAPEVEMMPTRLREVIELVGVNVHAARRHLVQQRLPQVRLVTVHEGDHGAAFASETVACARRKLEAAGAAADDDDVMGTAHFKRIEAIGLL